MTDAKYYSELADQDVDGAMREDEGSAYGAQRMASAHVHAAQANAAAIEHLAEAIERLADALPTSP